MDILLRVENTIGVRALSASNENIIRDVTVLVFNSSGQAIGFVYKDGFSSSQVSGTVLTRAATGCTVYAVANTGSSSTFKGVTTLAEMQAKYVALTSADGVGNSDSALMEGRVTGVTTSSSASLTVTMSHLCSKISVNVQAAAGIHITGYRLCHVPLRSFFNDESNTLPSGTTYGDATAVTNLDKTGTFSFNCYVYANPAGSNAECTLDSLRDSTRAPSNASYVEVYARTAYWHSTYRFYLGGFSETKTNGDYTAEPANFNVYRNRHYQMKLLVKGSGESDLRAVCIKEPQFLFSDGTWGPYNDLLNKTGTNDKTPVALVFSRTPSVTDRAAGYIHGYAMALKDANGGEACPWYPGVSAVTVTDDVSTATTYDDIHVRKDGRSNTLKIAGSTGYSETSFPAAYYALNYSVTPPSGTSGWYLPAIGQFYDIAVNLGGMVRGSASWSAPVLCLNNINDKLRLSGSGYYDDMKKSSSSFESPYATYTTYWSSSENNANKIRYFLMSSSTVAFSSIGNNTTWTSKLLVRPVIAF